VGTAEPASGAKAMLVAAFAHPTELNAQHIETRRRELKFALD
jgi:hypothetical protein